MDENFWREINRQIHEIEASRKNNTEETPQMKISRQKADILRGITCSVYTLVSYIQTVNESKALTDSYRKMRDNFSGLADMIDSAKRKDIAIIYPINIYQNFLYGQDNESPIDFISGCRLGMGIGTQTKKKIFIPEMIVEKDGITTISYDLEPRIIMKTCYQIKPQEKDELAFLQKIDKNIHFSNEFLRLEQMIATTAKLYK